jgi:hypothetical protein
MSTFYSKNKKVLLTLALFSILMLLVPLGTFSIFQYLIFGSDVDMMGYSGIASVVSVNVVVFVYVYMAWNEKDEDGLGEVDEDAHKSIANRNPKEVETKKSS